MAKSVITFSLPAPRMTGTRVGVCRFWLDSWGGGGFVLLINVFSKAEARLEMTCKSAVSADMITNVQIPWHDNRKRDLRQERPPIN